MSLEGQVLTPEALQDPPSEGPSMDDLLSGMEDADQDDTPTGEPGDGTPADKSKTDKQVQDREKYLRETQRDITRSRQELAELKEQLAEFRGRQQALMDQSKPVETDYLDDGSWRETFNQAFADDPAQAHIMAMKKERAELVKLLNRRDEFLRNESRSLVGDATAPERLEMQNTLKLLGKQVEGFSELPSKVQFSMARAYRKVAPPDPETMRPPGGGIAGGRAVVNREAETTQQRRRKAAEALAAKWGIGDDQNEEDALYPLGKPEKVGG